MNKGICNFEDYTDFSPIIILNERDPSWIVTDIRDSSPKEIWVNFSIS